MARFNPHHDNSKLYPAMREFATECLLRDGSVLQPGQTLWTPENLDELDRSFVQNPDEGEGTYYVKLGQQVARGSPDSRKLMAELHWLLFAFPSDITPSTKEDRVREIWSWSGEDLPDAVPFLDHGILEGLGHTGQAYNNHRWRELSFVIGALQRWKKMSSEQREEVLAQSERFTAFLDDAPGVEGRQLRHILPHLLFPDEFERISSPRHKREILEGFGIATRREVNKMDTASLDVAIFNLRKKLETEHGREVDFYEPDIESNWRDRGATYLISWNPTRWEWGSFADDREVTIDGKTVTHRWRTSSKKPKVDDRVYLLRTGLEPRGIIARGKVVKAPYIDAHWDEAKAQSGETTDFIDVEFEDIRDPALDAFVPVALLASKIAGQDWSPQSSGIVIKPTAVRALNRLWEAAEPAQAEVDTIAKGASAMAQNLILYGPPGTGKTYSSAAEAVRLCGELVPTDREALMEVYQRLLAEGRIEFVTFHQSMAYEDFVEGRQPMTGTDDGEEVSSAGFRLETVPGTFRRIAKRADTSRGRAPAADSVQIAGRQVFKMSIGEANNPEDAHLFEDAIRGGYTILGFEDIDWSDKSFETREMFIQACKAKGAHNANVDARSGVVQMPFIFRNWVHKGDIVVVSKGNGLFRAIGEFTGDYEFQPRPEGDYGHRRAVRWLWVDREGVQVEEIYSRRFAQKSIYMLYDRELNVPALERYMNSQRAEGQTDPEPFVLIIDEINRANISKVFGELITLLEPDKRLGQPNQIKVRLPYSGDEFGVPSNLHILGTMNTADRSIALLDTALRRRFTFRELMPDPSVLDDAAERTGINLPLLLVTINDRIEYLYDREHQIGHAYFTGCATRADVDEVMRHKVIPLLAEYFFEDWAKIAAVLGDLETHDRDISGGFLKRTALKAPPGLDNGEALPWFRWSVRTVDEGFDYTRVLAP
jgi:5-methylcytosine-specific restriction protein B